MSQRMSPQEAKTARSGSAAWDAPTSALRGPYLRDLEGYLADLLRTREKLLSFLDADEWARNEALPSDEEITRIRRLIARIKADVEEGVCRSPRRQWIYE